MKLKQTALGLGSMVMVASGGVSLAAPMAAGALTCSVLPQSICNSADTGDLQGSGTWKLLEFIIQILTMLIGVVAVVMVAYAGFLYTTAQSDENQVKKAKDMILNVAIGLLAYAFLWAFAQWLIPGGIFS